MNLKEAILSALELERKIAKYYDESAQKESEKSGKHFYGFLAKEEEGHINYLEKMLKNYEDSGKIEDKELPTLLKRESWVLEGEESLKETGKKHPGEGEMQRLLKALELEEEATRLYQKLADEFGSEGKKVFKRFLEIEEAHTSLVRAEVDYFNKSGYFYDFPEFSLESME